MRTRPAGFTLIELLVVIAIIAVLDFPAAPRRAVGARQHGALSAPTTSSKSASPAITTSRLFRALPFGKGASYNLTVPGTVFYARWSAHSQLLMFIEQGNLFNSINFNLAPETPGMAGDVPFMPPFQNANRENATASRTQVADVPLPLGRRPLRPRLARRQ